ncbi:hypothetical protein B7494_g7092 [Chlorociboria aeruginascens]|nr:hypothetical protein B7494_g7092 [Chlorociboria aeruginascens]
MTLPVACPPASSSLSDLPTLPPQRKRRRRAPASGASDDCFACQKRNTKCDRRRPYCSQCLEFGKECSGYKTQLTWGVGVASRGKLRGLSLPIAKSAPVARASPQQARPATGNSRGYEKSSEEEIKIKMEEMHSMPSVHPFTYDFINMAPHGTAPPLRTPPEWQMELPQFSPSRFSPIQDYHQDAINQSRQMPQLHRLHTLSLPRGDPLTLSSSIDSMSAYTGSDYGSPLSTSYPNEDVSFPHSPLPMYNSYSSHNSPVNGSPVIGMMEHSRGPTSCPDQFYAQSEMSSSISSHQNLYDIPDSRRHQGSPVPQDVFYDDEMLRAQHSHDLESYATSARSSHFGWTPVNDDETASQATSQATSEPDTYHMSGQDSMTSSCSSDMSPRVSFFLDYYEKIICPSVVVIDSPSNPYREHILSLASSSQSLQHAICALSACNLRMKRKQSLKHDNWLQPLELELQDRINGGLSGSQSPHLKTNNPMSSDTQNIDASLQEEYQHRTIAVSLLNQQLLDPSSARHDCVLATLFILCHYRMCESGIAQFRTQFAGVKKILGMRESGLETGNWGWMETLFTYFDGIAASINDREAQLRGGYLEMIANPTNSNQALENLAGCDAILFKTIAKLGRLNLLSQQRPVLADNNSSVQASLPQPRTRLSGQALADFYNLNPHNFDGNVFATTIDDEATFPSLNQQTRCTDHDDPRTTFWSEWKSARLALQEWEFSPSRLIASLSITPSATQLRDFGYISEAFRYSALLYTERLAWPSLPSSHLTFQNLVSQVLFYVTSLEHGSGAEKFLLWPLFISGSECVNELQQSIVRSKCREIMSKSGYLNNLAGLEVLEKLWAEREAVAGDDRLGLGLAYGGPFRWSRFMEGVEGEWIMV